MAASGWVCAVILALALGGAAGEAATPRGRTAAGPPPAPPTTGAPEMRIAAVVNDDIISIFDLVSRIRLIMISSNIADTPETRERIGAQVLSR